MVATGTVCAITVVVEMPLADPLPVNHFGKGSANPPHVRGTKVYAKRHPAVRAWNECGDVC